MFSLNTGCFDSVSRYRIPIKLIPPNRIALADTSIVRVICSFTGSKSRLPSNSTDLFTLFANQIDNAIEAYRKIEAHEQRYISVSIWRRESFIFFKVVNRSTENPLDERHNIKSSASPKGTLHGFGI